MKIYTRTGDDGSTSLFSGGRVRKDHLRVEAYGTVDELNAHLGMARTLNPAAPTNERLERVQNQLFHLGADLATPLDAKADWVLRVEQSVIDALEADIDAMNEDLEPLKHFVLPGGTQAAAAIHIARTVCRRAERMTVTLSNHEPVNEAALVFLNRLSDWLFVLARHENHLAGIKETTWSVR